MWLWWLACTGPDEGPPAVEPCDDRGDDALYVVQSLRFVRGEEGVSDGFDLDGSDGGSEGCGIADWAGPDGSGGVDNAFAYLLPALELTEAAAIEGLIQSAINSGELLLSFDLHELDDPVDDACVDLEVGRALGPPILGTDGLVLSGQTFDPDPERPSLRVDDVELTGAALEAPVTMSIPVTIFEIPLDFELLDGRLRAELHEDGTMSGVFAGGTDIAYLLSITEEQNVDSALHDIVEALLDTWADLAPDETGACTRISIVFEFEAVPAFWF